jgi:hypothetical protein
VPGLAVAGGVRVGRRVGGGGHFRFIGVFVFENFVVFLVGGVGRRRDGRELRFDGGCGDVRAADFRDCDGRRRRGGLGVGRFQVRVLRSKAKQFRRAKRRQV